MRIPVLALATWLTGCAALGAPAADPVDVLLLGEQHDAAAHPALQRDWIERLAGQGRLAALAVEMADRGRTTSGLVPHASEAEVRQALQWQEQAWPWDRYGPVVMAAVRAGRPVLGANLPREAMRPAMRDAALDAAVDPPTLQAQSEAIRTGHCGLLPEAQVRPMTRVHIARDLAMAQTLQAAAVPGQTVVLVAGSGHVDPRLGVPRHLPAALRTRSVTLPPEDTGKDYCAALRLQMAPRPAPAPP